MIFFGNIFLGRRKNGNVSRQWANPCEFLGRGDKWDDKESPTSCYLYSAGTVWKPLGPIVTAHIIQNAASVSAERPARTETGRLQRLVKNKFGKRTEEPIERLSEVTAASDLKIDD